MGTEFRGKKVAFRIRPRGPATAAAPARCADPGYDFDQYRRLLWKRGIKPMVARRGVVQGSRLGRVRWVIERTFAWLHQFKRLSVRYERRADLHIRLFELAGSLIGLRRLQQTRQPPRQ